jgi:uncharacterized protein YbcI
MTANVDAAEQGLLIANEITRLHHEHYGRGAATAWSVMGRNEVMVVLEDIYTPAERTLLNADKFPQVKETRQAFQMAMREKFTEAVEDVTGRKVRAFTSQVHQDPDLAVEVFIFAAEAQD